MTAILINIGLIPVFLVAFPWILLMSFMPQSKGVQRFRKKMVDWLDQVTNDYGAELVYLEDPNAKETVEEVSINRSSARGCPAAVQPNLIVFPDRPVTAPSARSSPAS